MDIGPGFVLSALIIVSGLTIFFFLRIRHMERMAMIEKGLLEEGKASFGPSNYLEIKLGMLMAGIGLGLMAAHGAESLIARIDGDVIYPASMLFLGGCSLFASYFVANRLENR